ncbi:MAG: hypothetical protein CMI00_17180 [Oceanospirillaceae bacterium]|nr:hypothetical protein [Oceanospirillaceae bacterium]
MRTMISAVVIATAIASPVFAENAHDHGDKNQGANNGMMMGMMNHDQMMAMHDHMKKMHALMSEIKTETDPEKRQQLMNEHMQTMQEGMQMMNMGNGMKGGKKMDKMDITKRMDMMEKHMGMMQKMMGQMMDHQSEANKSNEHQHK